MKIGILDSGIGGLSTLTQAIQVLPREDYLFYADTDHVPYGEKTKEEILVYTDQAVSFLIEHGAKVIVIACNTATSVAAPYLREKYAIPIIGMEPAVKLAMKNNDGKRVLVLATPVTIREEKLHQLLLRVDEQHQVDLLALPGLVRFAEKHEFDSPAVESYLRNELASYPLTDYSSVVLGCTHFNYFKDSLQKVLPNSVSFIDGCGGTVRQLWKILEEKNQLEFHSGSVEYFFSGRPATPEEIKTLVQLQSRLSSMMAIR